MLRRSCAVVLLLAVIATAASADTVILGRTVDFDGVADYLVFPQKFNAELDESFTLDFQLVPEETMSDRVVLDNGQLKVTLFEASPTYALMRAEVRLDVVLFQLHALVPLGVSSAVTVTVTEIDSFTFCPEETDAAIYVDGVKVDTDLGCGHLPEAEGSLYIGTPIESPGSDLYEGDLGPMVVTPGTFPPTRRGSATGGGDRIANIQLLGCAIVSCQPSIADVRVTSEATEDDIFVESSVIFGIKRVDLPDLTLGPLAFADALVVGPVDSLCDKVIIRSVTVLP